MSSIVKETGKDTYQMHSCLKDTKARVSHAPWKTAALRTRGKETSRRITLTPQLCPGPLVARDHGPFQARSDLVYFLNDDGVMNVVKAGPKIEVVAKNALGEKTYASPAISRGQIFLRSFSNLYCIGSGR